MTYSAFTYYFLWIVSFIGLFLGVFWINLLFVKESKKIKMKKLPIVSVIVPAYNEEKTISRTISSLLGLNYPRGKLEVIVVDDGSTDNTVSIVKKFRNVKLIFNKHRGVGKASAVNAGLKIAKGEFLGVLDADSEAGRNSLINALEYFSSNKVGCIITPIKVVETKNLYTRLQRIEYAFTGMIRELMSRISTLYNSHGVLSIFRTNLIRKLGGFDENNLTEDLEIAMRLRTEGYDIRMAHTALTYTRVPSTLRNLWEQRIRWSRGFIHNILKYKHVLFNKKYGLYGMFQLPLNVFSIILLLLIFVLFSYEIARKIYNWIIKIIILKLDIFSIGELPSLKYLLLGIDIKYFFPIIVVILINLFLLYKAHKIIREKTRFFSLTLLAYFILFPIFTMINWAIAFVQEVFQIRKKW